MNIILASASPRRAELLRSLGVPFRVVVSDALEREEHPASARDLAIHNAQAKARAVAAREPEALVIGADTVVVLGERVFGKPRDHADARRMLRELSGRSHRVITGVCLVHGAERTFAVETRVQFFALSEDDIERYVAAVNTLDKAGAYAIQEGPPVVENITGSYSNVVGLPLEQLAVELRALGMRVDSPPRVVSIGRVPHIEFIHTAPRAKAPMERQGVVTVQANFGIEGDRRAKADSSRQATFIEAEVIESAAASIHLSIPPGASRRNFTTRGVDLATLIGKQFQIGDAIFEGVKSCTPCELMETAVGRGALVALGKGGLCARVLQGGVIRDGMAIQILGNDVDPPSVRR